MSDREIYKKYLGNIRGNLHLALISPDPFFAYTIKFCEDNDLTDVFVACKLRADAFFGFARYKAGEITLETFEQKIIPILDK